MKKKLNLYQREWLRGYITATQKPYTLKSLKAEYRKYLKHNPSIKAELNPLKP